MISTAPSLVRRSKTDRIGTMLRQQQIGGPQFIKAGEIAGVGQFGTSGSLPTDSTPIDPPILTSGGPSMGPPASDYWTRMDPNMGYIQPSVQIDPSQGFPSQSSTGIGLSGSAPFPGNMGGPQGSLYGINPVTGNPVYNVTGSPRPGFFDSKTGKFASELGSAALNVFVPGLGFVSKAILNAMRRNQAARNTGTNLPHLNPGAGSNTGGQPTGPTSTPSWLTPSGERALASGSQGRLAGSTVHDTRASNAMLYASSQANPSSLPFAVADFRGLSDAEGMQHRPRGFASPAQLIAGRRRFGNLPRLNPVTASSGKLYARPIG